jgi:hypothetical protein
MNCLQQSPNYPKKRSNTSVQITSAYHDLIATISLDQTHPSNKNSTSYYEPPTLPMNSLQDARALVGQSADSPDNAEYPKTLVRRLLIHGRRRTKRLRTDMRRWYGYCRSIRANIDAKTT